MSEKVQKRKIGGAICFAAGVFAAGLAAAVASFFSASKGRASDL